MGILSTRVKHRLLLSLLWLMAAAASQASVPSGISEYIVPFDEDVLASVTDPLVNAAVDTPATNTYSTSYSVIAVNIWSDDTTIYYDHWEDGYDLDPNDPLTADERYEGLGAGALLNFTSPSIPRPRTLADGNTYRGAAANCTGQAAPATPTSRSTLDYCYDGRDRIVIVGGGNTVVRAGWPFATGTLAAAAEEVYPLSPQLVKYILPFGEVAGNNDFEGIYVVIQATEDDTTLQIDFDGDNTFDSFNHENGLSHGTAKTDGLDGAILTLQRGQTYILDRDSDGVGGLLAKGVVILGSKTLQVQYFYGDRDSGYNTRSVSAYPRGFWDDEYYAPVATDNGSENETDILLHNPSDGEIRIDWEARSATGFFTLAARETAFFQAKTGSYVPEGSGVYLRGSGVFWGTSDIDKNGSTYDWGYSLVPAYLVENEQYLAWAPGSDPDHTTVNLDDNGIFITPVQDNTTIFIDKDADGAPDTTLNVSIDGTAVAASGSGYVADRLQSLYVTSTTAGEAGRDRGLSGAHIWATGPIAVAYGENPDTAPTGSPGMDLGYTILPSPQDWMELALTVRKTTDPAVIATTDNPGTTTYSLEVQSHEFDIAGVRVVDTLATDWTYDSGAGDTTLVTLPDGSTLTADPTVIAPGNPLPAEVGGTCPAAGGSCLVWGGAALGDLAPRQKLTIVFTARTLGTPSYSSGAVSLNRVNVAGTRDVGGVVQTYRASDFAFNSYLDESVGMTVDKTSSVPEATPLYPGDTFTYTVALNNTGTSTLTDVNLYDALPNGTTYVPGTVALISGSCELDRDVRDSFGTAAYTNNDGTANWAGAWSETDEQGTTAGPTAGFVWVTGGVLQFRNLTATVADNFTTSSYARDDSTTNVWASDWTEAGDDGSASTGTIQADSGNNNRLNFGPGAAGRSVTRSVSVVGTSATVAFTLSDNGIDAGEGIIAEYDLGLGDGFQEIQRITNNNLTGTNPLTIDTTGAATLTLRFRTFGTYTGDDNAGVDTVSIAFGNAVGSAIERTASLTGAVNPVLSFTTTQSSLDSGAGGDILVVEASNNPAGPFTILATATGNAAFSPAGPYSLTPYLSANTTVRFRVVSGFNVTGETRNLDDIDISYSTSASPSLDAPPMLLSTAQGCRLPAGGSITLSYQASVNDPLAAGIDELLNVASASSAEIPVPISDDARNIVVTPSASNASVGDRVWMDSNGNGAVDVGEAGIAGVQVTLRDEWGTPVQVTTTDSQGGYRFTGVPPGTDYYVEITGGLPGSLTQTNGQNDRTGSFDLTAGQTYDDADLGYEPASGTAIVGDRVWSDADGDGAQDAGEPGVSGVTVLLYTDTNGNGIIDTGEPSVQTTTGPDGSYLFSAAATGTEDYIVYVDRGQPALAAYNLTTQDTFVFQNVANGSSYFTGDVGVVQASPGTTYGIKDRVWLDSNVNGIQDPGESGIAGVTVDLLDASGNTIATAATDAQGVIAFNGVPAGVRYRWRITDRNGVLSDYYATTSAAAAGQLQMPDTLDETDDDADGADDDVVSYSDPANPNGSYRPSFGYNLNRSIGDTVFNDLDGDGTQDAGESGIGGIVVELYRDVNGNGVIESGDGLVATLATDAGGSYLFSGLGDGGYIVSVESPPAGYSYCVAPGNPSTVCTGAGQPADSDGTTSGQQRAASVTGGVSDLDNDFGYTADNPAAISGRLWEDTNRDGDDESGAETGLAGVTVELYGDTNGNGQIDAGEPRIGTAATDANGHYSFSGIQGNGIDDYVVRIADDSGVLSGYQATYEKTGGTGGPFDGLESVTNLSGNVPDLHFGYYKPLPHLPITLASFVSRISAEGMSLEWTTATETRNAGFHLYGRRRGEDAWQRLTEELIPSNAIDSLEPQRYSASLPGVAVDELLLEDWDTQGQTERHGPFEVDRLYGFDAVANSERIDWRGIRAENRLSKARRSSQPAAIQTFALSARFASAGEPSAMLALASEPELASAPSARSGDALLWVTEPGVQRVSFDALQAAGADFGGVDIAYLALTDKGKAYTRHVIDGNANGVFDSGDSVEFVGKVAATLYSARNAYRLQVDPSATLVRAAVSKTLNTRGAVAAVFPDTARLEQERAYSYTSPTSDPWYDQWLFARGKSTSLTRTFDLPGYAGSEAAFDLSLWGVTDWPGDAPDHRLVVKINGTPIEDVRFDGSFDASRTLPVPHGLLKETGNTLTLEAPGDTGYDYDIQAFDGFSVEYDRRTQAHQGRWEGTVPVGMTAKIAIAGFQGESVAWKGAQRRVGDSTVAIQGAGSWIAADTNAIRQPQVQVEIPVPATAPTRGTIDYAIVTHSSFMGTQAMDDLLALQQGRGYRTALVDVDSLYAAYSDFEVDPTAIRRWLSQARPAYVLLVGGDSYDYQDRLGLASQSFVPTHYLPTGTLISYTPADSYHVDYTGTGVPQARLGRLPVRTEAELTLLVAKLIDYAPPTTALLAAGPSDNGRAFAEVSEGYGASLPEEMPYSTAFADDLGLDVAKPALGDALQTTGALVSYVGHSSYAIWGLNPSHGILLSAADARLSTNDTPHLVTQWGCWNTYFVDPKQDTMANAFLFQERGAAAVLGATSLTDLGLLQGLGEAFFDQVGRRPTLGDALLRAQQSYAGSHPGTAPDLRGFALLGDPAAELR